MKEKLKYIEEFTVEKFENEKAHRAGAYYEKSIEVCSDENCLLNAGITLVWNLIAGLSANHYNNANAEIGIGSDDTAAVATQTDLVYASAVWKGMDTSYPLIADQTISFRGEFGAAEANFAWKECAVRQGSTDSTLLNRIVIDKGTKTSGEIWLAKLQITLS